uniref:Uncharacterized protein n=1 Tax=Anopheles farauti TaxID=69004 RepID=A0A182QU23_9DIPT
MKPLLLLVLVMCRVQAAIPLHFTPNSSVAEPTPALVDHFDYRDTRLWCHYVAAPGGSFPEQSAQIKVNRARFHAQLLAEPVLPPSSSDGAREPRMRKYHEHSSKPSGPRNCPAVRCHRTKKTIVRRPKMMRWVVGTVMLLLLFRRSVDCETFKSGSIVLQYLDEMVQECAELLSIGPSKRFSLHSGVIVRDGETKCLLRCVGVNARFWSDHEGLRKDQLARYFLADAADTQNVNRTQHCLDALPSLTADPERCCDLALESFLCFYHNYGNLRHDRIFVPLDQLQLLHVTARCMDIHQITMPQLMSLGADELDANSNVHCLVRCIGIKTGIYTDRDGVNIDRIYAQYGDGYCEKKFKNDATDCIQRLGPRKADINPSRRAYNLLYKCFENVRNVISEYEMRDSDEN